MENLITVIVFSTGLSSRPNIKVVDNPTRLELKTALEEADIEYEGLSFSDSLSQKILSSDSQRLSSKSGKGLLVLSPKRNKAGASLTFVELRAKAKRFHIVKECFIAKAKKLNKNWTQLSTEEMNVAFSECMKNKKEEVSPVQVNVVTMEEVENLFHKLWAAKEEQEFQKALQHQEDECQEDIEDEDDEGYDEDYYDAEEEEDDDFNDDEDEYRD